MRLKINTENFIEKAKEIHGARYDYSKSKYESSNKKIEIICKDHGPFFQQPNNHLSGKGCLKCGNERKGDFKKIDLTNLLIRFNKVHQNKFEYPDIKKHYKDMGSLIIVKDKETGKEIKHKASLHLYYNPFRKVLQYDIDQIINLYKQGKTIKEISQIRKKSLKTIVKILKDNKVKKIKRNSNWKGYEEIPKKVLYKIEKGAIDRKLKYSITKEYIWDLFLKQNRKCAYTGRLIEFSTGNGYKDTTASLDRIDLARGYTEDNVQWVHKTVNVLKMDLSHDEFISICREVTLNYGKNKNQEDAIAESDEQIF